MEYNNRYFEADTDDYMELEVLDGEILAIAIQISHYERLYTETNSTRYSRIVTKLKRKIRTLENQLDYELQMVQF